MLALLLHLSLGSSQAEPEGQASPRQRPVLLQPRHFHPSQQVKRVAGGDACGLSAAGLTCLIHVYSGLLPWFYLKIQLCFFNKILKNTHPQQGPAQPVLPAAEAGQACAAWLSCAVPGSEWV